MQKRANQSAAAGAHARLTRGDAYARGRRRFLGILHELKLRPSQKADFSQAKHRLQHQFRDQKFIDFQFLNSRENSPKHRKFIDMCQWRIMWKIDLEMWGESKNVKPDDFVED